MPDVNREEAGDIDLDTVVARSAQLVSSQVDGDIMMMNAATGKYYSLASVGARVWELLGEPKSARQLCASLAAEYRVERSRCEQEVVAFIRQMTAEGVLAVTSSAAPAGEK